MTSSVFDQISITTWNPEQCVSYVRNQNITAEREKKKNQSSRIVKTGSSESEGTDDFH